MQENELITDLGEQGRLGASPSVGAVEIYEQPNDPVTRVGQQVDRDPFTTQIGLKTKLDDDWNANIQGEFERVASETGNLPGNQYRGGTANGAAQHRNFPQESHSA